MTAAKNSKNFRNALRNSPLIAPPLRQIHISDLPSIADKYMMARFASRRRHGNHRRHGNRRCHGNRCQGQQTPHHCHRHCKCLCLRPYLSSESSEAVHWQHWLFYDDDSACTHGASQCQYIGVEYHEFPAEDNTTALCVPQPATTSAGLAPPPVKTHLHTQYDTIQNEILHKGFLS